MSKHANQAMLVFVDTRDDVLVLSVLGDGVKEVYDNYGSCSWHMTFLAEDRQDSVGFHVWEGDLEIDLYEDPDTRHCEPNFSWTGTWRLANADDFRRFGLAVPS